MKSRIYAVLAIKNGISQGYPFLEAIKSFLEWGDRLYISDGGSTDGTEEVLKRISKNKKIRLYTKQAWAPDKKHGTAIGEAFNHVLSLAKADANKEKNVYFMEIQANEVIHEETYSQLKDLPDLYPQYKGYILPYQVMVGPYLVDSAQWRLRMIPSKSDPIVMRDAVTLHPRKELSFKDFAAESAASTFRYLGLGLYHFRNIRRASYFYRIVPLSRPIFRYNYIFPGNLVDKSIGHAQMYKNIGVYSNMADYITSLAKRRAGVKDFYYDLAERYCSKEFWSSIAKSPRETSTKPVFIPTSSHPETMRDLLDQRRYEVREKIINGILRMD